LDLSCKNGMKIDIRDAVYGRSDRDICMHRSTITTANCASKVSTDKVKQKCNGHSNCKLRASNRDMGGDPCRGITKYLYVKYVCEGKFHGLYVFKAVLETWVAILALALPSISM